MPYLLVDESVTKNIREWLRKQGFDAINVSDTALKGARDSEVASYAAKNRLTIFTLDTDYAQIYHNSPKWTLGVIVIRVGPSTPDALLEMLIKANQKINLKNIHNQLAIVTKRKMRIIS